MLGGLTVSSVVLFLGLRASLSFADFGTVPVGEPPVLLGVTLVPMGASSGKSGCFP